jgi:hypothetical protein
LFVGEVPAGLDALAGLAVEILDAVGGVDRAADVGRQREERGDVGPALPPGLGDHRILAAPELVELGEGMLGGLGIDCSVGGLQRSSDLFAVLVGDVAHA